MHAPATPSAEIDPASRTSGQLLALLAVLIWAGWLPATSVAVAEGISAVDLCLLRYGVPALLLAPVLLRTGLYPRGVPPLAMLALMGWGAPFVLLLSTALGRASVLHASALVPCTMPLIAAAASWLIFGEPVARARRPGMVLIGIAAALVLLSILTGDGTTDLATMGLLLLACCGWAAYTVAFRRSGLKAVEATAFVCFYSTLLVLPVLAFTGSALSEVSLSSLAFHITAQGILSGFVAAVAYGLAIDRLGMAPAAAFSVLVPVMATVVAYFWMGEVPSALDCFALGVGTLGVAIVNGLIRLPRRAQAEL